MRKDPTPPRKIFPRIGKDTETTRLFTEKRPDHPKKKEGGNPVNTTPYRSLSKYSVLSSHCKAEKKIKTRTKNRKVLTKERKGKGFKKKIKRKKREGF